MRELRCWHIVNKKIILSKFYWIYEFYKNWDHINQSIKLKYLLIENLNNNKIINPQIL